MKRTTILIGLITTSLLSLLFVACVKDLPIIADFQYGIDPTTQKDLLCKSLRLNGNNIDGKMPVGQGGIGTATVTNNPTAVEISAGILLYIPYSVNDTNKVCKLYLQVEGANNYWETKMLIDPTSKKPYFSILIPKFVHEGDFKFVYSITDCNGSTSILYSTRTVVKPIADCNTTIRGAYGITVRSFDLGAKGGLACFNYDMFTIPDRLDIRYNGQWVKSTGTLLNDRVILPDCNIPNGFVSNQGQACFNYDPNISRFVEVYVSGCLQNTEWEITATCPQ
jgi:hypothetical protein